MWVCFPKKVRVREGEKLAVCLFLCRCCGKTEAFSETPFCSLGRHLKSECGYQPPRSLFPWCLSGGRSLAHTHKCNGPCDLDGQFLSLRRRGGGGGDFKRRLFFLGLFACPSVLPTFCEQSSPRSFFGFCSFSFLLGVFRTTTAKHCSFSLLIFLVSSPRQLTFDSRCSASFFLLHRATGAAQHPLLYYPASTVSQPQPPANAATSWRERSSQRGVQLCH